MHDLPARHRTDDKCRPAKLHTFAFRDPAALVARTLEFTSPVVFFTGEPGSGAATLLKAIAIRAKLAMPCELPAEHEPSLASAHTLARSLTLQWAPRTPYGVFLRPCDLHPHAPGEGLEFIRGKCIPGGLNLIDTPECAFTPRGQLAVLALLKTLSGEKAQFIISTHSPILLACPGAQILNFDESEIAQVSYANVPSVKLIREFLAAPDEHA